MGGHGRERACAVVEEPSAQGALTVAEAVEGMALILGDDPDKWRIADGILATIRQLREALEAAKELIAAQDDYAAMQRIGRPNEKTLNRIRKARAAWQALAAQDSPTRQEERKSE